MRIKMQRPGLRGRKPKGAPEGDPESRLAAEPNLLGGAGNLTLGHQQDESFVQPSLQTPLAKGHASILMEQPRQRSRGCTA